MKTTAEKLSEMFEGQVNEAKSPKQLASMAARMTKQAESAAKQLESLEKNISKYMDDSIMPNDNVEELLGTGLAETRKLLGTMRSLRESVRVADDDLWWTWYAGKNPNADIKLPKSK